MTDHKNIKGEKPGILNPDDLKQPELSESDIQILERKKFIIQSQDMGIFDMLPLDSKQKADFLNHIIHNQDDFNSSDKKK